MHLVVYASHLSFVSDGNRQKISSTTAGQFYKQELHVFSPINFNTDLI